MDKQIERERNRRFGYLEQIDRNILSQQIRQIERYKLLKKNEINSDEILILWLEGQIDKEIDAFDLKVERQKHFIIASQIDRKKEAFK